MLTHPRAPLTLLGCVMIHARPEEQYPNDVPLFQPTSQISILGHHVRADTRNWLQDRGQHVPEMQRVWLSRRGPEALWIQSRSFEGQDRKLDGMV